MFVLGIDTATKVAGAAVIGEDRLISERFIHNQKNHSQNIIPMIQQVMEDAGIKPEQLDGIAVTGGPGSFTGLRIGMSVAKTMGMALKIPVASVSTLKALAWNLLGRKGLICPILDAKKNEVYTCVYSSKNGQLIEMIEPMASSIERLTEVLRKFNEPVTLIGDAVPVYGNILVDNISRIEFGTKINSYPRASAAAELGLSQLKAGNVEDYTFLQPVYLRKSEAELTWEAKHGCGEV